MIFSSKQVQPAALTAALLLALTACGSGAASEPAAEEGSDSAAELTVYNAQHESMTQAWVDEFTEETGIEVTVRQGSDTEMSNQILQEGEKSPADVFITENSPAMTQVENAGLFADIPAAVQENVPEEYRPTTGKWTGVAARSTLFVYNPDKISEADLPTSIMDLSDPKWAGRWGAAAGGADFQAIVSAMLELEGEEATAEWLAAMKDGAKIYPKNGAAMKAVNAGEVDAAVIYHYYYTADQAGTGENSSDLEPYYFKGSDAGAFVSISGAGVLKSSDNQDAANQFLEFITSKEGQETLSTGSDFEYPVSAEVTPREGLVPLAELEAPVVDPAKLNGEKVVELMTDAGLL
ncbi:iron ABC transporter substrate-binding protein [Arthrobacter zhaoguopingii]|uniref:iron ABC transporter substrate-binding protein n=1 Tax=Arthrobacter zhaoguopingii TaxID=2681491 RepID=UPI001358617F|nr:iron ABC transporter substrate-binding protein [Arthrobacter zhaoguopingii]